MGNTLHCANRAVRLMILDSLRHWAGEMHVDGFRFDLASVFARNSEGTSSGGAFRGSHGCSGTHASGTTSAGSCAASRDWYRR